MTALTLNAGKAAAVWRLNYGATLQGARILYTVYAGRIFIPSTYTNNSILGTPPYVEPTCRP